LEALLTSDSGTKTETSIEFLSILSEKCNVGSNFGTKLHSCRIAAPSKSIAPGRSC
jgi:hypothetical protein